MTWIASNLVHGRIGRMWMAVRDMDHCGRSHWHPASANQASCIRDVVVLLRRCRRTSGFPLVWRCRTGRVRVNLSFFILFMIIIGGLGSLTGSFFGAALIFIMPIALRYFPPKLGIPVHPATVEHIQYMIIGRVDRAFPDCRAGRTCAVVAGWQAEIEGVAFPLLTRHNLNQHPGPGGGEARKRRSSQTDRAR